jgi:hypothetical protein
LSSSVPADGAPSPAPVVPSLDQAQTMLAQYALDPGMPPDLAGQVVRVLSAEGDPDKLDGWAAKLDQLHYPKAAQALRAKASALRAVQGAGAALGQINSVLSTPPSGTAPSASVDTTGIRDRARDIIARAAQLATQQPSATDAAAAVSRTAAAAARAATTNSSGDMQTASQEAAHAASMVLSPVAASKASVAVVAAQAAMASGSPAAIADASSKILDVAAQVLKDAAKAAASATSPAPIPAMPFPMPGAPPPAPSAPAQAAPFPMPMPSIPTPSVAPMPSAPAPGGPSIDDRARLAAQAAAADIRAKGCWHENRDLVKEFQRIVYPAAGEVDGFYGPAVALAMAKYLPKVPAPCYWPKAPADRARAKADWQRMVKQANVNVGRLWMGG